MATHTARATENSGIHDRVAALDALRGLAAAGVVVVHSAYILPLTTRPSDTYFFLSLGVPLFFVISAFSMAMTYHGRLGSLADVSAFAIRRVFRIAPLFYLMLLLWIVFVYQLHVSSSSVFLNVTFTFSLFPEHQNSLVPAGWSIGVEMLFYCVFPLLVRLSRLGSLMLALIASLVALSLLNTLSASSPFPYFYWTNPISNAPYFLFGLVAWRVSSTAKTKGPSLLPLAAFAAGLGGIIVLVTLGEMPAPIQQKLDVAFVVAWGTCFALIVYSQVQRPIRLIVNPATCALGTISYSLYLIHPFVIYTTGITTWASAFAPVPELEVVTASIAVFVIMLPLATLVYVAFEQPLIRVGRDLAGRAKGRP